MWISNHHVKVRDGKKGGHKLYRHPAIPGFPGGNFNCGHSAGDQVLQNYIKHILSVIDECETEGALKLQVQHFLERMLHGKKLQTVES